MKIFLAGNTDYGKFPRVLTDNHAPYILQSFYDYSGWGGLRDPWDDETVRFVTQTPEEFLLDSGAFSFFHKGDTVDWDGYAEQYIDFINRWDIKGFFELDIDAVIGTEAVERITKKIEDGTGKQSIPVFHQCRGMRWYREACEKYDYIAISASGLTEETRWTRNDDALRQLIKIAHDAGTKVHGLGYTRLRNLNNTTVPFDSVDSTSWRSGGRFATVYKFTGDSLVTGKVTGRSPGGAVLNDWNAKEWVKMCRYKAKEDV